MSQAQDLLASIGVFLDEILLPAPGSDMNRWAVVACDQYTSEPEYWNRIDAHIGETPSTLRLIFPEVWLERESEEQKQIRISEINRTMAAYLRNSNLVPVKAPVLVERTTREGHRRLGLMVSLDLERYDFSKGSQSLVRATEGTILDRLPPRIRIRENAGLELPHIMVLIDDPKNTVIEPLHRKASNAAACSGEPSEASEGFPCVYDFSLMENSGHLKGWKIKDTAALDSFASALVRLAEPESFRNGYGVSSDAGVLLFAVGDGNHSLATAKSCWEHIKKELSASEQENHPARHALVELVNVHDKGLVFEPIHRVLFHSDRIAWRESFLKWHEDHGIRVRIEPDGSSASLPIHGQHAVMVTEAGRERLIWENPDHQLAVGSLQAFLDVWLSENRETSIDYVHGEGVTSRLGAEPGNMGFLLPVMEKEELFPTVIRDGALPRKTFSMGEAHEKRFYLECRRIR